MDRVYKPRIQADTMKDMARKMVSLRGKSMTKTAFTKMLKQDKDLRHMVYRSGSMSQHQAQKFIKTFAKKVGDTEHMDFSHFAKEHSLHTTSRGGDMSQTAVERAYQLSAQEEVARETPKGPTPQELQQLKMEERKKKLRNLANRKMADMLDSKKGKSTSIFDRILKKEADEELPQAAISAAEPRRKGSKQTNGTGQSGGRPGFRMPLQAGIGGSQRGSRTEESKILPPLVAKEDATSSEDSSDPDTPDEDKNSSIADAPEESKNPKESSDIEKDLPL